MGLKPGYKLTEVGIIPVNWEVTRLGLHGETYGGLTGKTKKDFGSGNAHYVTFMNVMSNVIVDPDCFERVHVAITESQNLVQRSDLLFNGSSETPDEVALCAVVLHDVTELYLNSFCFGYRLQADKSIDPIFLSYLFRSQAGRKLVKALAQGSTRYNISKGALLGAQLALPPLHEQRVIATSLTDIDALLVSLDRLIAKKRDLKQAAMQQLLTGQTRLPGFSGEWLRTELKHLVRTPITDGPHLTPTFYETGVPFLSVNNLTNNRIDLTDLRFISKADDEIFSRKCKPQKGDVLLGKAASVGKVAIVEDDLDFNIWSPIALVRSGETVDAKFLYFQLLSADSITQVTLLTNSSSQGNIGMGDIEKIQISYPCVDEQIAISKVLTSMDMEISALESRRKKTEALKQGMMQELLTGRTRLI